MPTPPVAAALIVVDVQNDFCPGGALAVRDGDAVVPIVNRIARRFPVRVYTQDWHAPDHRSFATSNPGAAAFSTTETTYGSQVLWPDHCVQGTPGAAFHPALDVDAADLILRKGFRPHVDSYSAFFENDRTTATGLAGYLRDRGVREVWLAGLATDFCVAWSALDAAALGFGVTLIEDAAREIDLDGSHAAALARMGEAGVAFVSSTDIA
jgi:nicotinamidase/pyrazinamidase